MRFHVNGYHLKQYMTESNGWTNVVWNEVDFVVFGSHFRRLQPSRQAFQMKIVHNQLPTGDRRFRQAPIQDEALRLWRPCCKSTTKTMEHLFTFPRNTGRPSALSTLKSDIVTSDPHPVRCLLQAGLRHWLSNSPTPFVPSFLEFPMHFHESINKAALASQARIAGWYQATKGYLSKHWRVLATMGMHHPTTTDPHKGNSRMRSIIHSIYKYSRAIWLSQNSAIHATDNAEAANIRSSELAEIRHYHAHPNLLQFADRHLCSRSLPRLLKGSASTRRRWLHCVKTSIEVPQRNGSRQSRITLFFSYTTA